MVDGDTAERRLIRTGYSDDGNVEVIEGLDDDEQIVVVGQTNLKNGSKVSVINEIQSAHLRKDDAEDTGR